MSEMHPDPLAEAFRHGSTNAQTAITGVARIMEQRLVRQERERRFEAEQQRQMAEQARTEAATIRALQAARERQMQATQEQDELVAEWADRPAVETVDAAPGMDQQSEVSAKQVTAHGTAPVDQAVADAYPAGPTAAAATAVSRASSSVATQAQTSQRTHGPGVPLQPSAGLPHPSAPEMG